MNLEERRREDRLAATTRLGTPEEWARYLATAINAVPPAPKGGDAP